MEQFVGSKYISEQYNIGITLACKHKKRMIELYEIDKERLPRRDVVPLSIVKKYFNQSNKKNKETRFDCDKGG